MKMFSKMAAAAVAVAMSASAAQAQIINFTTGGSFSGAGCLTSGGTAGVSAFCEANGGVRLTYNFGALQVINGFGNVQYGSFATSGVGPSTFANVTFQMLITQTLPTAGAQPVSAGIAGTLQSQQGGLIWSPVAPTAFNIGQVNYTVSVDAGINGIRIDPPNERAVGDPQTIRGTVSVVPEPSTYALMAAGLAAMAMVARRRRNTTA